MTKPPSKPPSKIKRFLKKKRPDFTVVSSSSSGILWVRGIFLLSSIFLNPLLYLWLLFSLYKL
nr:MAG TPA: hypothetical protein [Caudoviricetes sp.]